MSAEEEKLVPVKVTLSFPRTEPKRVLIVVSTGVFAFDTVTALRLDAVPSTMSLGTQE